MGPLWRTLVPVGLVLVALGFVAGAVVAAGSDEPPPRQPVEMVTAPSSSGDGTPTRTPSARSSRSSGVPVVTPRPGVEDRDDRGDSRRDDDGDHDDDDDGDDDGGDDGGDDEPDDN